ncbi:Phosphate regulon transcriptional regulatory protein PhoB [Frondihabitans sp. 762G35]|uniref:response regulator transcription factor n=1 Tax=Frondihabitans sp. 762G35 TaxID=1446794 RepID=UPI000D207D76|nr:response regulator transcription factor [Frondihabitans sp. 762G35]ARC57918.1 Phosphate regulon transcriptional regulatory protein PhoB [Frondihabitans sp. 762G35]
MLSPARILLVDDDETIRTAVATALDAEGFSVREEHDGRELASALQSFVPDLVILDWMLPGPSGIQLATAVRTSSDAGVVMMTARDEVDDRLRGFSEGADDYVVKPFAMAELVARVTAVLRRRGRVPAVVEVGDLLVDPDASLARRAGATLDLTATEFRLLAFLASSRGRTLSKGQILTQVWGYDDYDPNLVEVHLSSLRKKMEAHGPRLIHTVRGLGYRMAVSR